MKTYTTGHCKENAQPNGCQLHNLFCEWPECDRRLIKATVAKCPFCGKSETLTIGRASDAFSEPDECGDPMPYMHTESYAVTCDASKPDGPGGCGASGGYKLTEDDAIAAWNRRAEAVASQPPAQAEPAPAPVDKTEFYLSGPYPNGTYGICEASTCRIRHIFNPATDDYQGRMNTTAPVGEYPAKALDGVQAFEFDPPPYHSEAMGCGLEDRGIKDRYEAMAYGWDAAMGRAAESIPDDLVSACAVSALQARIAELESVRAASTVFMDAVKIDRLDVEDWPTDSNNAYQCLKAAIDAARKESK